MEAGATVNLGLISLDARLYEQEDDLGDVTRTNRGIRFMLSSRYAAWLPVISGTRREGVVR